MLWGKEAFQQGFTGTCSIVLENKVGCGDGHERRGDTGTPAVNAEKGQCKWRALKTGDTASCRGTRAGI